MKSTTQVRALQNHPFSRGHTNRDIFSPTNRTHLSIPKSAVVTFHRPLDAVKQQTPPHPSTPHVGPATQCLDSCLTSDLAPRPVPVLTFANSVHSANQKWGQVVPYNGTATPHLHSDITGGENR